MEIRETGLNPINIIGNYRPQFGSSQTTAPQSKQIDEIQNVTPQYNISKPISYNHIEDIKLPNELTAHYYKLANGQRVVIVPKKRLYGSENIRKHGFFKRTRQSARNKPLYRT